MNGVQNLWLFIASSLLLNITPGPDTFYILGRSLAQGRRAGILSALGISAGCLVHTLAAAVGLSAVLAASSTAFVVLKLAGAAYLVYLGVKMWRDRTPIATASTLDRSTSWQIFRSGMLTNVLNPKVAIFFLAFLPQFVDPATASKLTAFLFLGCTFIVTGTTWSILLALVASTLAERLRSRSTIAENLRRGVATLFVALGVKLAISR